MLLTLMVGGPAAAQEEEPPVGPEPTENAQVEEMRRVMEEVKQLRDPGPEHRLLGRFIGEWETGTRITMPGMPPDPDKGTVTCGWLLQDRWLECRFAGTMMGMPIEGLSLLGYDRFKKSYTFASVSSVDTAMFTAEGDLDPRSDALIVYGTMDEYLTGEHDKMVRYVWRFPSADEILLEVHDLAIGETGTQVVEVVYRRQSGPGKEPPGRANGGE
jgi:hypothetical protein